MVRKKDELWKHGVELKGRFKCNFCERDFAGGIARLKSHLSGIKGRDIEICTKAPDDVQAAAFVAIHGSRKKAKTDSNVDNPSLSLPKKLEQSDIMNTSKKNDKNAIDRLLCQLLILNDIPFSVVQTPSFIRFVKGVSEYGVGYELPCCTTLKTTLVSDSRAEVDEYDSDQDNCENELLNLIDKIFPDDTLNEADLSRNCVKETHSSESRSLKLQFSNKLCLPIFSGTQIQGEDYSTLEVALVDCLTGKIVKSGPESSAKVEIVLLKGDIDDDEDDNWTVEEFNNNIVRETAGEKPLLAGDTVLNLKDGVGYVGEISFTDKSSWTRSHKLGARIVDISDGTRVLEAKTESFIVRDRCGELLYRKYPPPSLFDEAWRLEGIAKDGAFHKHLSQENINTVEDFCTLLSWDPPRLKNADADNMLLSAFEHWEEIVSFDDEASLIGNSVYFTNVPSSSSTPCFSLSKDFPSPGIISSLYCVGETSGSDDHALHTIESMDLSIDQTLNFPGQVSNLEHITRDFCNEDSLQSLNTNLQSQNMSLQWPAELPNAVEGFLFRRSGALSVYKAHRRWTKLVTVLKWFLLRLYLNGNHVGRIQ